MIIPGGSLSRVNVDWGDRRPGTYSRGEIAYVGSPDGPVAAGQVWFWWSCLLEEWVMMGLVNKHPPAP